MPENMSDRANPHGFRVKVLLAAAFICSGAVLAKPRVQGWFQIDRCLDSGGSFDYQACSCDYEVSHTHMEDHQCW
jgi:hypothetical protein